MEEKDKNQFDFNWLAGKLKKQFQAVVYSAIPILVGVVLVRLVWEWIKFVWTYQIY